MSISCPNKRLKAWRDLVQKLGETRAYLVWAEYDGNVPNDYYQDSVTELINENVLPSKNSLNEFVDENAPSFFQESKKVPATKNYFDNNKSLLFAGKEITSSFTAKEVLQNIIDSELEFSDPGVELIMKAMNVLNKSNSRVKVVGQDYFDKLVAGSAGKGTAVMAYNSDLNSIYVTENSLANFNSEDILESFLHEVAHNLSVKALVNPETFAEKDFKELIFKAFEQYKYLGNQKNSESYGFTNEKEFVAELYSNAKFRQEIIDLDKGFWAKFKDSIRRLFGLPKTLQNSELINSILLIEKIESFIETGESNFNGFSRDSYGDAFGTTMFKKVEDSSEPRLDTIDKQLDHFIGKSQDKINSLLKRTKANKDVKDKTAHENFIKGFQDLLSEIKLMEDTQKWKAVSAYTRSFSSTVNSLDKSLKAILKNKDSEALNKDIDKEKTLQIVAKYEEYLASYDLLEDINELIDNSVQDDTVKAIDRQQVEEIQNILDGLTSKHKSILANVRNVKKANAIRIFSDPSYNTKVTTEWRNKLYSEHSQLKNSKETKEEYFGRMIEGKYKKDYEEDLLNSAKKIVNDPYFDISFADRYTSDLLNIDSSPLISIMANVIGKIRDAVKSAYAYKQFEMSKLFDKYSKIKGQNKQSEMYKNLVELSKNDQYYLRGEYSIEYLNAVENELYPITNRISEIIQAEKDSGITQYELALSIRNNKEIQELNKKKAEWFKKHTASKGKKFSPHPRYKNKDLTGVEKEVLDYFKSETQTNDKEFYKGKASLVKNAYGAVYYKVPSATKSNLERTLEGDITGQVKDKWTDLTQIKVDEVEYSEAFDSKNKELRSVRINFRGKLESKDQSLDLFTVYRKEALNAINYKEKSSNELKLKLFADISRDKKYKKRSSKTGKWAKNIFDEKTPGLEFKGEHSQELQKIEGLIETHLHDVLSYNGGKVLNTNIEASKLASMANGAAASIAMTANIGSGVVNVANGVTQLMIEALGGRYFSKSDLLKAEANYTKNIMKIMADWNQPVKKAFHNQLLDMFDVIGGFDTATQEFIRNSYAKSVVSTKSLNGINEAGEHMMNAVMTEAILRGIKVMDKNRSFIDKDGNKVSEDKAASLFDMLYTDNNGKLAMSDKVVYTEKNLNSEYHKGGKQHINYVIKKKGADLFGVYDALMKAEIAKTWWGKTVMMFKNFFLSALRYRTKGFGTSLKKKEDLTDDDLTYSNADQEFTEGIYTTFIRFGKNVILPSLKGLQLAYMKDAYSKLTDYEKANLRKTTIEIGLTMVILPVIGMLLGAAADGDDDDNIYFWIYVTRRLESELSQFRDPRELNRMIQNPIAANRFIQNSFNAISDIISPLNFNPEGNEQFFDYLSENKKGENKLLKDVKKVTPFYSQMDKNYKQLYGLINK